jgi:hypothetical protein
MSQVIFDSQYNRKFTNGVLNQVLNTTAKTTNKVAVPQVAPYLQRIGQIGLDGKLKLSKAVTWPDGTSNIPVNLNFMIPQ